MPSQTLRMDPGLATFFTTKFTAAVLKDADTRQRFTAIGLDIGQMTVKEFNDYTVTELAKWSKLVKDSGAKVD